MSKQETCEERIDAQLAGRLQQIGDLFTLTRWEEGGELTRSQLDALEEAGWTPEDAAHRPDEAQDDIRQALAEIPLGVSASRVFRIDLSTGGPGDRLEVRCSGDTPAYEGGDGAYEIDGASYHFNDWFDHAERELRGDELATAEAFAREVVPELAE